ncbi:nucleotidyltransferase domain-containing protein [Paenibacillus chungangensis]|uniref:Nucleotidyltransferase family protein n=1 Tax=Paenibacillus chungangensis TaxID=696535 RepID=A0ABW3HV62_9BACL
MINDVGFHTKEFSQEMRLLLALLEVNHPNDYTFEYWELLQDVDWPHFIQLARHHRVFPSISRMLSEMDGAPIPSFVTSLFQRDYYRNTLQMLALSGEMEQLAGVFSEHDIELLFLKGPVIAADLYGDVSLRTSCDLDLLIPIQKLAEAEALLEGMGYRKDDYITTILNDWKWRHHHITFHHPDKKIKVEVHWRWNPSPSKEPSFQEQWERKRQSSLISRPIYYLGREDLFMFLISHGARHGWSRIRWLLDIKKLANQKLNWPRLIALLRKHQYSDIGGQALFLTAKLLASPLREEMRPLLTRKAGWLAEDTMFYMERMVNLHSPPVPQDVQKYHKKYLFSLMTPRQKIQFMTSFLFPFPEDAETLPLPKKLHFLYFPLRPILWAWRKAKRQAA